MVVADKTGADRKGIAILDLKDHKITASFKTVGEQVIYRYWWANDERVLIATATQTGSLDSPIRDGRLYGINVDGSHLEMLLGNVPAVSDEFTHVHSKHEIYIFARILNIYDGSVRDVATHQLQMDS